MNEVVPLKIKPKEEAGSYKGTRYVLRFDPNAPDDKRWVWTVNFTVTYPYMGAGPTLDKARQAAHRQVRKLIGDNERYAK